MAHHYLAIDSKRKLDSIQQDINNMQRHANELQHRLRNTFFGRGAIEDELRHMEHEIKENAVIYERLSEINSNINKIADGVGFGGKLRVIGNIFLLVRISAHLNDWSFS
jgi:septal ring factor EnvC (AmiA/AmiB activator)